MTGTALQNLWVTAESLSPAETELAAHATGIRSTGFDICVGMDGRRRRHLLVPLPHGSASAPPFRSTGLFVSTRALLREGVEHNYLDLVCRSEEMNGAFSSLVLDVLQQMSTNEPAAAEKCLLVLEQWKELFGSGSGRIGREQVAGLLGELLVLDHVTAADPAALQFWDGPTGGIHDFRNGSRAIEVKTTTKRYGRHFTISGQLQLSPPAGGNLHFVGIKLEQNPGGALSLPALIERIRRNGVHPPFLFERLAEVGYELGSSEDADSLRFDTIEQVVYRVDDSFPRLIPASFEHGQLPPGIIKLTYEIDLSGSVPGPILSAEVPNFFQAFAAPLTV